MSSFKQIQANRRNAQKSTGPKTDEGKEVSRLNALKHGLLAEMLLLPDESVEAFEQLREGLYDYLLPVGSLESELVERIASYLWRLRRCGRIEANLLFEKSSNSPATYSNASCSHSTGETENDVKRHNVAIPVASGQHDIVDAFRGSIWGTNPIANLSRYEASLDRPLYRALHELQRLQAARKGDAVSAPAALDVNVSLGK